MDIRVENYHCNDPPNPRGWEELAYAKGLLSYWSQTWVVTLTTSSMSNNFPPSFRPTVSPDNPAVLAGRGFSQTVEGAVEAQLDV